MVMFSPFWILASANFTSLSSRSTFVSSSTKKVRKVVFLVSGSTTLTFTVSFSTATTVPLEVIKWAESVTMASATMTEQTMAVAVFISRFLGTLDPGLWTLDYFLTGR